MQGMDHLKSVAIRAKDYRTSEVIQAEDVGDTRRSQTRRLWKTINADELQRQIQERQPKRRKRSGYGRGKARRLCNNDKMTTMVQYGYDGGNMMQNEDCLRRGT